MIFRSLRIDGFGIHHDFKLDELGPGLNVVHGENEAGKSTLLSFVRAAFWGFESKAALERTSPVNGGKHGGSIVVETVGGERLRIARHFRAGVKLAGELSAEDVATGSSLDPELAIKRALGNSTRLLFENVFAIGLDDLVRHGQLGGEGLRNHIYGAGMTGGGVSLPDVLEGLRKRARELLPPAGRGGRVTKVLDEISRLDGEAKSLAERPEEHRRAVEEAEALRARLAEIDAALPARRAVLRRAERLAKAAPVFAELAALPKGGARPVFPAGGLERLRDAKENVARARAAREKAVNRRDDLARKLKRAAFDARLVDLASEIDAFWAEADRRLGNDAPGAALVKARAAADRARVLKDALGPEWKKEKLDAFDASPASERELLRNSDRFAEAERVLREARRDADLAGESEVRERDEIARLTSEMERIGDAGDRAAKLEKRVVEFERALEEERIAAVLWADVQRRASTAGTMPDAKAIADGVKRTNVPLFGAAGLLAIAGLGLVITGNAVLGAALLVLAVAPVLFAVYRLPVALPMTGPSGRETEEAKMRLDRAREARADRSTFSFGRPDGSADDAHAARGEIGRLRALEQRNAEVERLLAEKKSDLAKSGRVATEKRRVAEEQQKAWEAARATLRAWMTAHDFPVALPVESARSTLLAVREVQAAAREVAEADAEVQRLEAAAKEFAERVDALGKRLDRPGIGRGGATSVHVALTALRDDSLRSRKAREERERDKEELEQAEADAKAAAKEVEAADAALTALIAEADVSGEEAFYERARAWEAWVGADASRTTLEGRIRAALGDDGDGEAGEASRARIGAASVDELEREGRELQKEVAALESERDAKLQALAQADLRRASLEKEDKLSAVRLDQEARRAELGTTAEQWRAIVAAEWLLEKARKRFEEEHQPGVLRSASEILDRFTRGRWTRIRASGDDPSNPLRVTRWDGETLGVDALSRGTLDQLYLSLRLALAAEFPDPGVRIPVVLDDVLVNFSRGRREAAAEAIADVARKVQIFAFTSHPELRDAFLAADPGAKRIELADPSLPASIRATQRG